MPNSSSLPKPSCPCPYGLVAVLPGLEEMAKEVWMMVMTSHGMPSFFVSRIEAKLALEAAFKARSSGGSGTSMLMVLLSAADWMIYVSKTVSF